ncbi:MAG: hypothetical protein ACLQVY_02260 [Limisphaerales bacterium]
MPKLHVNFVPFAYSRYADPVHKISIVPRGQAALGYTLQVPEEDHYLMNQSALLDKIKGQLGGRAAEDVIFHDVSTGAENDLQHATALARQMVAMFGMSDVIGLAQCARREGVFDLNPRGSAVQRDCSEQTAREIDEEVKKILSQAYGEAKAILQAHHDQLELVASKLLEHETLDAQSFQELLHRPPPAPCPHHNGA